MAQDTRYGSNNDPYEPRYTSYDDQFAEPVDLDEFGTQLRPYHSARSVATREDYLPDDSVPLFLSGSDGTSKAPRFGSARTGGSSRLLKVGILAIAASVAAFTAVAIKNPFTVFANATASLIGISDVRSTPAPVAATVVQPAVVQPVASARAVSPTAGQPPAQAPSRDEIAGALRAAQQPTPPPPPPAEATTQMAAVAPLVAVAPPAVVAPPIVPAPPPVRKLGADELATLMTRARALLAAGDIPSARLLLERAAEAQEANAALMLAQTYDPAVMGTQDMRNINTDPALARSWYQRAAQLGSADAQRRLSQLQ
jgi:hypothetical protein